MSQAAYFQLSIVASHSCTPSPWASAKKQNSHVQRNHWLPSLKIFSLVFACIMTFNTGISFAQPKPSYDSSHVQKRSFSSSAINQYKSNSDFQYEKEVMETPSLWEKFWDWFWNKYDELTNTPAGRTTMKIFYWVLGLSVLSFFVYKVMQMNRVNLFGGEAHKNIRYTVEEEDVHAISFESAIGEALEKGNFRLAIRLLYLQSLKILSDKDIISWLPNKTNTDYYHEISNPELQQQFKKITDLFEHIWYGNTTLSKDDFDEMKEYFYGFQNKLQA